MGTTQKQAHKTERAEPPAAQLAYQRRLLLGLNMHRGYRSVKHIYAGTVPDTTIAKRHRKAKAAKRARRLNRSK